MLSTPPEKSEPAHFAINSNGEGTDLIFKCLANANLVVTEAYKTISYGVQGQFPEYS